MGLFGEKGAYFHLETPKFQEVFLSKTNSVLTRKQCARCSIGSYDISFYFHLPHQQYE
jgi:hypothetical protein